jgi:hypothetical protein
MKEDIIRMAQEAGFKRHHNPDLYDCMVASDEAIERFAALVAAAERNKLIAWMMAQGYTYDIERDKLNEWMGYTASQGDATKDLLTELGWQIEQRIKGLMSDMSCQVSDRVKTEREACAAVARQWDADHPASNYGGCIANLIEARGQA